MLNLLGSIAEFERELMLERKREGIAKAKAEGKYKGRAPTARAKAKEVLALRAEGLTGNAIAERLAIGRASVFRILRHAAKPTSPRRHDMGRSLNEGALERKNDVEGRRGAASVVLVVGRNNKKKKKKKT